MAPLTGFCFNSVDFTFKPRRTPTILFSDPRRARTPCLLCRKAFRTDRIHLSLRNFDRFRSFSTNDRDNGVGDTNSTASTSNDSATSTTATTEPPKEEPEETPPTTKLESDKPAPVSSRVSFLFLICYLYSPVFL